MSRFEVHGFNARMFWGILSPTPWRRGRRMAIGFRAPFKMPVLSLGASLGSEFPCGKSRGNAGCDVN
jgi:hypothetical protein